MSHIKKIIKRGRRMSGRFLINLPGWHTNRKIVVIESDDWGTIRMPSREVYNTLLNAGIRVDNCSYSSNDSLESGGDLSQLMEVAYKLRDKNNNPLVFTLNYIVANPDFEKIEFGNFKHYYFEPFTETYSRYSNCRDSYKLLTEGITNHIFHPQFHGREHLNINRWMKGLQNNLEETRFAFDNRLFGIGLDITTEERGSYMAELDIDESGEIEVQAAVLCEGLNMFEQIFQFRSESFIAANSTWRPEIEAALSQNGIKTIQVNRVQLVPHLNNKRLTPRYHFTGQQNRNRQVYIVRNVSFEPSTNTSYDWVNLALREIEVAFKWKKPAIIGSHRVNFIGSINPENRTKNLKLFYDLIKKAMIRWPEIEFLTSDELGRIIKSENRLS